MLTPQDRTMLKEVARLSLQAAVHQRPFRLPDGLNSTPALQRKGGAFVTLHKQGELRGCIGTFDSSRSLIEVVAEMAEASGTNDPRFSPVSPDELDALTYEISVLTPELPLSSPGEIEIGRHGLIVSSKGRRGVLLPQVPVEWGWDRLTFLEQTCKKAGLPKDAWQTPGVMLEVFEAEVF